MYRLGFLLGVLLLALLAPGCARPPAPLPAELVAPDALPWPEQPVRLHWLAQDNVPRRSTPQWQVALGNDRVIVSVDQLHQANLVPGPEAVVQPVDLDRWSAQIRTWRLDNLRQSAPWAGAAPPAPTQFLLFVSPDCGVCSALLSQWPAELPLRVIPLSAPGVPATSPPSVAFAAHWCRGELSQEDACAQGLWRNSQAARRLGIEMAPALLAPDGRLLDGWPDADWLRVWWDPSVAVGPPPPPLDEPDL